VDAWRIRSVGSASDSARIRPKTVADEDSLNSRRLLSDTQARGDGDDDDDDDDDD
jgi:hypothetical protein